MEHITDRVSNPFGMRIPCREPCSDDAPFVPGYGDANADFHVIGDHPDIHGGKTTAIPFTGTDRGRNIQRLLVDTAFQTNSVSDRPVLDNCFLSYLYMCCWPTDSGPPAREYHRLERYFDAELRAINAHILLPVGPVATQTVIESYTTQGHKLPRDMADLHATEIRGRGVLVVPISDPGEWTDTDRDDITKTLIRIKNSDYRQTKGVATWVG